MEINEEEIYQKAYNRAVEIISEQYKLRMNTAIFCWKGNIKKHIYDALLKSNYDICEELIKYGKF
jgi:hypothetical protein